MYFLSLLSTDLPELSVRLNHNGCKASGPWTSDNYLEHFVTRVSFTANVHSYSISRFRM